MDRTQNWGRFIGAFEKLRKATISFVMSVRLSVRMYVCLSVWPHRTTRFPQDNFSWNLKFEYLSKICLENSSFIKIRREWRVRYIKTYLHFWSHLSHFCLEWEFFRTKVVEEIKTQFISNDIVLENRAIYEITWKIYYSRAGHRWQYGACASHAGYPRLQTQTQNM
jgi:hypothetical protein